MDDLRAIREALELARPETQDGSVWNAAEKQVIADAKRLLPGVEAVVKAARAYMAKPFNEDDAEIVNLERALTALDRTGEAPEAVSRFYGGAVSPEFVADAIDRETPP